jgi:hypothetical protein
MERDHQNKDNGKKMGDNRTLGIAHNRPPLEKLVVSKRNVRSKATSLSSAANYCAATNPVISGEISDNRQSGPLAIGSTPI